MCANRYRDETTRDWIKTGVYIAISIGAIVGTIPFLLPHYPIVWGFVVVGTLVFLIRWHAVTFAYRCPVCGEEFEISITTDAFSPHGMGRNEDGHLYSWKFLKCPNHGGSVRAIEIAKVKD